MPPFWNFLTEGPFIPHGHCYLWKPGLVGLHIIGDSFIALAYYSIPLTLLYFVRRREDLAFSWMFLLFGAFIIACGTTHIMEVWTLWHPIYWVSGWIKFITAVVSVYTAVTLFPLVPQALALPSPAQLEAANVELKREIANRVQAEESLRESEERFRNAFDYAAIGVALADLDGRWLKVNRSLCEIVGYSEPELLATTFQAITYADDLDADLNYMRQLLAGEIRYYNMEKRYVHKQGHTVWILLSVSLVRDINNQPKYFISQIQDITERKRIERELEKEREFLKAVLENVSDGIVACDASGHLTFFNRATREFHGLPAKPLPASEWAEYYDLYLPDGKTPMTMADIPLFRSLQGESVRNSEMVIAAKQGKTRTLLASGQAIFDAEGTNLGAVVSMRDITERKEEAEIRNALAKEREVNELKTRFITMASHEFRTPLATILSSTELLEYYSHKLPDSEKRDLFGQINTAIQRITQLLNDVLEINKAEAGKIECNPVALDLLKFCREVVSEMQLSAGKKHQIVFTHAGDSTSAVMDEKMLRHILSNLLNNAIKYSPDGGVVEFEVACQEKEAIFKIKDCGIGIPLKDREKLFQSFHRASNVGNIQGTGLGLSIVKRMVELHGGSIAFESEVGVGTTFVVTLPLGSKP